MGELANIAYAAKQAAELLKDVEKEVRALHEQYGRLTCVRWVADSMNTDINASATVPDNIRTEYCTATPDVKHIAAIPTRKKDPIRFGELMRYLGVPEDLWNVPEEDEVIRPHWPGLVELLSTRLKEGKSLPPGIEPEKTYPQYRLLTRGRKAADE